jgi:hypothetical protein
MTRVAGALLVLPLIASPALAQQRYEVFPIVSMYQTTPEYVRVQHMATAIVIDKVGNRSWWCVAEYGRGPGIPPEDSCTLSDVAGGPTNHPGLALNENYQIKGPIINTPTAGRPGAITPDSVVFWLIDQSTGKLQFCDLGSPVVALGDAGKCWHFPPLP